MTHTTEQHSEAMARYLIGEPLKVIAHDVGMHLTTVYKLAKKFNLPLRRDSKARQKNILILHGHGMNKHQIAKMTGCCYRTVHNTIKAAT